MAFALIVLKTVGWVAVVAGGTGIAMGLWTSARDTRSAQTVWDALLEQRELAPVSYDPAMVADLPEIGQRYFANAIPPGTPLHKVARLEMEGSLILSGRELPMRADQILAPPHGFVWRARAGSGLIRFAGSDGYWSGYTSWTRFWLWDVLPVARIADTEDHARAAAARMVMETVWAPAALLPQSGAVHAQAPPAQDSNCIDSGHSRAALFAARNAGHATQSLQRWGLGRIGLRASLDLIGKPRERYRRHPRDGLVFRDSDRGARLSGDLLVFRSSEPVSTQANTRVFRSQQSGLCRSLEARHPADATASRAGGATPTAPGSICSARCHHQGTVLVRLIRTAPAAVVVFFRPLPSRDAS